MTKWPLICEKLERKFNSRSKDCRLIIVNLHIEGHHFRYPQITEAETC